MQLDQQQQQVMSEKRMSDGSDGLPPISKARRRKGKGKAGSLHTTSVPLTPDASCSFSSSSSSSHFDLQQPSRLSIASERAPVVRRSTVSDAGQMSESLQDVATQLGPSLEMLERSPASSSKSVDHSTAGADAAAADISSFAGRQHASQCLGFEQHLKTCSMVPAWW